MLPDRSLDACLSVTSETGNITSSMVTRMPDYTSKVITSQQEIGKWVAQADIYDPYTVGHIGCSPRLSQVGSNVLLG